MAGDLVLITGASGHLGFRVLVLALQAVSEHHFEGIIVTDVSKNGVYVDALIEVTYIIHCASPPALPTDNYERDILKPAVTATTGILSSALRASTIKRVVITSSTNAIISWEDIVSSSSDKVFYDQDTTAIPAGPFNHPFEAYSAAKVSARHATDEFVATNQPNFDIINIMPSFLIGKNELVTDLKNVESGTNIFALSAVRGYIRQPAAGITVHNDDAAKVHVLALDNNILKRGDKPLYDHFLVSSGGLGGTTFNDAIKIVKKNFKREVEGGLFPLNGSQPSNKFSINSDRTEKVFGIKFSGFEEQVKSVVEHCIELSHVAGIKTAQDIEQK